MDYYNTLRNSVANKIAGTASGINDNNCNLLRDAFNPCLLLHNFYGSYKKILSLNHKMVDWRGHNIFSP
jgi:hypothetical protein